MSGEQSENLLVIELEAITENPVALRGVDRENQKYKDLVSSIAARGVMEPIQVAAEDDGTYRIINGLQRYSASLDAGKEKIPCHVLEASEEEILEMQIEANLQGVPTKPGEYTKQLIRLMAGHPERTIEDQAERLHMSAAWLKERLQLKNLCAGALTRLDADSDNSEGISLSNAYALAKIPTSSDLDHLTFEEGERPETQEDWLDRASEQSPAVFIAAALAHAKLVKGIVRGDLKARRDAGPLPVLRKKGDLRKEYERCEQLDISDADEDRYQAGYRDALQFIWSMDPAAQAAWQSEKDEREQKRKDKADEKAEEKRAEAEAEGEEPSVGDLFGV
jgi:ParB/RepB/Spo0J family partition protein